MANKTYIIAAVLFSWLNLNGKPLLTGKLGDASVRFENQRLTISTGLVEREWLLTPNGLKTKSITNIKSGKTWHSTLPVTGCDWSYEGLVSDTSVCNLITMSSKADNDEGFTTEYLNFEAEFEYPATHTFIKYTVWAYPNTQGIRTQVWIKGKATTDMLNSVPSANKNALSLKLNRGTKSYNYSASNAAKQWDAATSTDDTKVEYLLSGMRKNKGYKLGLSWWDFEGKGRIQKVSVASIDGEKVVTLLAPTTLPDYTGKNEMPQSLLLDIPDNVSLDGSLRIMVEPVNGKPVTVGEIWIYEKSGQKRADEPVECDAVRHDQLLTNAPEYYSLVAYTDCGRERSDAEKATFGRCDFVPLNGNKTQRLYAGYFNDTQNRNLPETPLLKEQINSGVLVEPEKTDWASIAMISEGSDGIAMVKESHKCVNQPGVETGDFVVTAHGLSNRGTSLMPADLSPDSYKWYWASWTIVWQGDNEAGRLAIKQFDRARYTVIPELDKYTMANTWGSSRNRDAAVESNVLKEINIQARLGIDIQQIDDGWQDKNWHPSAQAYPTGWKNVVERAKSQNVKLGLWGAAMPITAEALRYNYDNAGFTTFKLDFANLSTHDKIDETIGKIRSFVLYTKHNVRVNWDVTENAPRYGYFWAREYGSVFLENRKPDVPAKVVYVPHLVLRDLWHLAKYANLNKFQGSVQNVAMVDKTLSDANLHTQAYCTAIPLMSTPLFFMETQFLSEPAIAEIQPILAAYKKVRTEIYDSYIYPIGNEPDNVSWSGFQAAKAGRNTGYITVFRELNNTKAKYKMRLNVLHSQHITLTNLLTGQTVQTKVNRKGILKLEIAQPGDFRFYKYEVR